MGPAYFIIAILGCGESDTACDEIGRTESSYQSISACTVATETAMMAHSNVPYPVVVAQCRPGNGSPLKLMSREVELPGPGPLPGRILNYAASPPH